LINKNLVNKRDKFNQSHSPTNKSNDYSTQPHSRENKINNYITETVNSTPKMGNIDKKQNRLNKGNMKNGYKNEGKIVENKIHNSRICSRKHTLF